LNKAGMDIRSNPYAFFGTGMGTTQEIAQGMPYVIPTRQSLRCQVLRFGAISCA
jgi:hypothetical protein